VMKEKLKMIKAALREWLQNHTHNIPSKISKLKEWISELDEKGEDSLLGEEKVDELHGLYEELHSLSRIHSSICWQQSRLNWLR
jgi:seryl-tRNA(Sec) selenium transferase